MKILYLTDLHGSKRKYDILLEIAKSYKVDIVINGGDMMPKHGDLFDQNKFIIQYLKDHFLQFERAGIYYLCYPGNDDLKIYDELFEKACDNLAFVHNIAQRKYNVVGNEFIGMNWVVDYPFRLKDRCRKDKKGYTFQTQLGTGLLSTASGWHELNDWFSYADAMPTIEDELKNLIRPDDNKKAIYVIHMPPTKLALDKSYRYAMSFTDNGLEVGSEAVYEFILENQPLLTLHGHIHESPEMTGRWFNRLGRTLCIQPGQSKEKLTYVLIDLDTLEIERFEI